MPAPLWEAGTLYPTGSIVQPVTGSPVVNTAIVNAGFESGNVNWALGAGWAINMTRHFAGAWGAEYDATGTADIDSTTIVACSPGQSITASCMVDQGASSAGQAGAQVRIAWLDAVNVQIGESLGNLIDRGSDGSWFQSSVTGVAPAGTFNVKISARAFRTGGTESVWVDNFVWNYVSPPTTEGLIYKAVQPAIGTSAGTEPVWPTTIGVQVIDNTVTWEALAATRVVWEAEPILITGALEPTWPIVPGAAVSDNNIRWTAFSRRVEDVNCPQSVVVCIIASKVFAGDDDIVRFSATSNPLDWSAEQDAGFLPTGLQQSNANGVAVLAPYRSNLCPMNASSFQNWQVDPDPAAMAILDQMDGIGSKYHKAAVAVAGELVYLTGLGIRSVSNSAGNNSLTANDFGMPIDPLVQDAIEAAERDGFEPFGYYYPALGQYWLVVPETGVARIAVYSYNDTPDTLLLQENTDNVFTASTVNGTMVSDGYDAAFSPDGRLLALPHNLTGVAIYRWDGTEYTYLTDIVLSDARVAAFSPDGQHLCIGREESAGHGAFKIYVRVDDDTWTEIYSENTADQWGYTPTWTDDGLNLVVASGSLITPVDFVYALSRDGDVYTPVTFPQADLLSSNNAAVFAGNLLWLCPTIAVAPGLIYMLSGGDYTYQGSIASGNPPNGAMVAPDRLTVVADVTVYTRSGDTFVATGTLTGLVSSDTYRGMFLKDGRLLMSGQGHAVTILEEDGDDYAIAATIRSEGYLLGAYPVYNSEAERCTVYVGTMGAKNPTWSRYVFPFAISELRLLGNDLYARYGDTLGKLTKGLVYDERSVGGEQVTFPGRVQWNWQDHGQAGVTKHLRGFDIIATGSPSVSIGYDERDPDALTTPYAVDADTLVGGIIPLDAIGPTFSLRVDFAAGTAWSLASAILYIDDLRGGP